MSVGSTVTNICITLLCLVTGAASSAQGQEDDAAPATVILRATELERGPQIDSGLTWTVHPAGGSEAVFAATDQGMAEAELPRGSYDIFVERPSDGLKGEARNVKLRPGAKRRITVALPVVFKASIRTVPESEAPAGSQITVHWTGPNRKNDTLVIVPAGAKADRPKDYAYVRRGNPVKVTMPPEPGDYEVRYVLGKPARVLASAPLKATAVNATLHAPDTADAGAAVAVTWTGPGTRQDYIALFAPGARNMAYESYAYTKDRNPVNIQMALEPGEYELRYVQQGKTVLARRAITVLPAKAGLFAPENAKAGATVEVTWHGPRHVRDFVTVVLPGARGSAYTNYFFTHDMEKATGPLTLPLKPGTYELRYVQQGKKVLARRPITVE